MIPPIGGVRGLNPRYLHFLLRPGKTRKIAHYRSLRYVFEEFLLSATFFATHRGPSSTDLSRPSLEHGSDSPTFSDIRISNLETTEKNQIINEDTGTGGTG